MPNITTWIPTLIALGLGGVLAFCLDRFFLFIIQNFYPEKWLADIANDVATNLAQMKKKYPTAEATLETDVINSLNDAIKKISAV